MWMPKFLQRAKKMDFNALRAQHTLKPAEIIALQGPALNNAIEVHRKGMTEALIEALRKSDLIVCTQKHTMEGLVIEVSLRVAKVKQDK